MNKITKQSDYITAEVYDKDNIIPDAVVGTREFAVNYHLTKSLI